MFSKSTKRKESKKGQKTFHCFPISGVRQEQDIYVRLIDSVTKQVRTNFQRNRDYVLFTSFTFLYYVFAHVLQLYFTLG
jgi:hypothetical protein